jgi:hypothetical protein
MPFRLVACLFAIVLCWSSLSTFEVSSAQALSGWQGIGLANGIDDPSTRLGSVAHHHLDDVPSQAGPDLIAMLPRYEALDAALGTTVQPGMPPPTDLMPPYLEEPLRPPRHTLALQA